MEMKKLKISHLQRLQMQRVRLQAESDARLEILDGHWEYLRDNFGSLMMGSASTAVRSNFPPAIRRFIPSFGKKDENPPSGKPAPSGSVAGSLLDMALEVVPFVFKGARPAVAVFVLKKIKDFLFKQK